MGPIDYRRYQNGHDELVQIVEQRDGQDRLHGPKTVKRDGQDDKRIQKLRSKSGACGAEPKMFAIG